MTDVPLDLDAIVGGANAPIPVYPSREELLSPPSGGTGGVDHPTIRFMEELGRPAEPTRDIGPQPTQPTLPIEPNPTTPTDAPRNSWDFEGEGQTLGRSGDGLGDRSGELAGNPDLDAGATGFENDESFGAEQTDFGPVNDYEAFDGGLEGGFE